jgi:hypothetical protein
MFGRSYDFTADRIYAILAYDRVQEVTNVSQEHTASIFKVEW